MKRVTEPNLVWNRADVSDRGWVLLFSPGEQNQNGILAMLDEECLRPGTVTDITFLDKLNTVCADHQHFESRLSKNSKFLTDHSLPHSCFRIQHYAGKVRESPRSPVSRDIVTYITISHTRY